VRRPQPAIRLRLRRIELKPKDVFDQRWSDYAGVKNRPELQDELIAIIRSITRGDGVPEAHYRAGIDQDEDSLLTGLGGNDPDVIVFLIQYADRVVLLETNSHIHFRTQPAGKNIVALSQAWLANMLSQAWLANTLSQAWLANMEHGMAEAAASAQSAVNEAALKAAEEQRSKLAVSIAAFKAKAKLK
jgi:hypothetical protein